MAIKSRPGSAFVISILLDLIFSINCLPLRVKSTPTIFEGDDVHHLVQVAKEVHMSNRLKITYRHVIIGLLEQDCISTIREAPRYYKQG